MSNYESVLQELEDLGKLQKSMGPDDDGEENDGLAAAGDDGDDGDDGDGEEIDDKDKKRGKKDESIGKSLSIQLSTGETAEVIDAEPLLKAMSERIDTLESALGDRDDGDGEDLGKALGGLVSALKTQNKHLVAQSELIKALRDDVDRIGSQGTGRKSKIMIHERGGKPGSDASDGGGLSRNEILQKADAALSRGRITGSDVARVEAYLNNNSTPPDELMIRINRD